MVNYFQSIFQSNGATDASEVVDAIQPVVTDSMNGALTMEFQADEVIKALKQLHPKKAPGLDGTPPLFYQHY